MQVQFTFTRSGMVFPKNVAAYRNAENNFLIIKARIAAGPRANEAVIFKGELPSCAPYFRYQTACTFGDTVDTRSKLPEIKQIRHAKVTLERLRPGLVKHTDVLFLEQELLAMGCDAAASRMSAFAATFGLGAVNTKPDCELREYAEEGEHWDDIRRCDLFRKEREQPLRELFSKQARRGYRPEQDAKLQQLSEQQLTDLEVMCRQQPWLLCFRKWATNRFGLAPMAISNYDQHIEVLRMAVAPLVSMAVKTHAKLATLRNQGHTLFTMEAMQIQNRDMRMAVFRYLKFKAIRPAPNDNNLFAFLHDFDDAQLIVRRLVTVYRHRALPQQRLGNKVPCIVDQELSAGQQQFVETLIGPREAPISLLQGGPGTGKSKAGLEWLLQHYSSPLILTFTAMMVNAGQQRMGNRVETMHTIHYVIHVAKSLPHAREWLATFDVLVIDEASNVDTHLLAKLLRALPEEAICKLVMLGDLGQIYPISPGCPFRDLITLFPQHTTELTENKRVQDASRILADTAQLVNDGHSARVDFTSTPDVLTLMPRGKSDIEDIVAAWCHTQEDIMHAQFLVLRNQDRRSINKRVESALLDAQLISKRPTLKLNSQCTLYVGQKIAFTKNLTPQSGDPVRNGELGQVMRFSRSAGTGAITITLTSGKTVCVHSEIGIPSHTVDLGYASTCNKAQGSEWERACFYMYPGCDNDTWWCRSYSYVAVSRAKQQCIVLGTPREFVELGKRAQPMRYTVLNYLLRREQALGSFDRHQPSDRDHPTRNADVGLLDADTLAVPGLSQFAPAKKKKKKKKRRKKGE